MKASAHVRHPFDPAGFFRQWEHFIRARFRSGACITGLVTNSQPASAQTSPLSSSNTAFNVEAATRAYLDRLAPEKKQRSDAYFEGG